MPVKENQQSKTIPSRFKRIPADSYTIVMKFKNKDDYGNRRN